MGPRGLCGTKGVRTYVRVVMKSLIIITEYFHSTYKHSSTSLHFGFSVDLISEMHTCEVTCKQ